MKAIIELSRKGSIFRAVARQVAGWRRGRTPDYRLGFESARALFAELTPARLEELRPIERSEDGAVSVPFDAVEIRFPLAQVA